MVCSEVSLVESTSSRTFHLSWALPFDLTYSWLVHGLTGTLAESLGNSCFDTLLSIFSSVVGSQSRFDGLAEAIGILLIVCIFLISN